MGLEIERLREEKEFWKEKALGEDDARIDKK
jgi:hypothetical protein